MKKPALINQFIFETLMSLKKFSLICDSKLQINLDGSIITYDTRQKSYQLNSDKLTINDISKLLLVVDEATIISSIIDFNNQLAKELKKTNATSLIDKFKTIISLLERRPKNINELPKIVIDEYQIYYFHLKKQFVVKRIGKTGYIDTSKLINTFLPNFLKQFNYVQVNNELNRINKILNIQFPKNEW